MTTTYAFAKDTRDRLAGIETTWDAKTIRHLEALGVGPGWRCLEVGAGGGTIAEWLALRVSPHGDVLAVDLDTRFVDRLELPNLEARSLDVRDGGLPTEAFDLVHARLLLSHVHTSNALELMLSALRPGGVILLEDFDFTRGGILPSRPLADRAYDAILGQLERHGWDRAFGAHLYGLLAAASLEGVGAEGTWFLVPGGSPVTAFERLSFAALRGPIVDAGALSDEDMDDALALLDEPGACVMTGIMCAAWGRKPSSNGRV